ncbi:helix-turn-helix domain-containing protein [Vagococcus fluvialis]|uniref:helix-turn-helix domain-containing protein n=1 Tax=Vagococcus fluvialis TaxID=2738 RepID=UPI0028F6CF3C|nr:helix-turn-helix domain-containing protein [Vagococcus fluvialis]WNF91651.1 helix-turn-helix domain-containing protein [Vagococcus fluvialis]
MINVTEIAEKLQISKMMVYRFINNNEIKHSAKNGRTFLYDMTAFEQIKEGLKDKSVISSDNNDEITENKKNKKSLNTNDNNMIIEIMKSEIEIKNKQIEELTEMNKALNVTLQQQQQLLLYEQQKNTKLLEENIENKRWWQWWK